MNKDDYFWTFRAMKVYGGSFARILSELWFQADMENSQKIVDAWPNYIAQYKPFAEKVKDKEKAGEKIG